MGEVSFSIPPYPLTNKNQIVMKKSKISTVTAAQIQDQRANRPNIDATFTCPQFEMKTAHIQEKTGGATDQRHLVVKTPVGVRYIDVATALDSGLLAEVSVGVYEPRLGVAVAFNNGDAVVSK